MELAFGFAQLPGEMSGEEVRPRDLTRLRQTCLFRRYANPDLYSSGVIPQGARNRLFFVILSTNFPPQSHVFKLHRTVSLNSSLQLPVRLHHEFQ